MMSFPRTTVRPADLQPGDQFESNRREEGVVTVVCPYGNCRHGHDDRVDSIHVRGFGNEWFIALPDYEPVRKIDN